MLRQESTISNHKADDCNGHGYFHEWSGYAVEDMVNSGQLITYPLDTQIHRKFYLLYRKKREKKPVVDSFIRFVMDFYKDAGNER